MNKPKISIDLFSETGVLAKSGEPTMNQVRQVLLGCLSAVEQLGQIKEMLEVIKISFSYIDQRRPELNTSLKAILVEPGNWSKKFEANTNNIWSSGDYAETSFDTKRITRSLISAVRNAVETQIRFRQSYQKQMQEKLDSMVLDQTEKM